MAMDPVQQTLVQQGSGSADGQGFGQFFVEGRRQGLMRRQLEAQDKQEERLQQRQDMMLPLEAQQTRLQNANLGITAVANLRKGIAETQVNAALPKLYQLQIEFAQSPQGMQDKALIERAYQLNREVPAMFYDGMPGSKLMSQVQSSYLNEVKWKTDLGRLDQAMTKFGTRVKGFDQYGNLELNAAPTVSANLQESHEMIRLTQQLDALPPGDPRRPALEKQIELTREQTVAPSANAARGDLAEAEKISATREAMAATQDPAEKARLQLRLNDLIVQTRGGGTTPPQLAAAQAINALEDQIASTQDLAERARLQRHLENTRRQTQGTVAPQLQIQNAISATRLQIAATDDPVKIKQLQDDLRDLQSIRPAQAGVPTKVAESRAKTQLQLEIEQEKDPVKLRQLQLELKNLEASIAATPQKPGSDMENTLYLTQKKEELVAAEAANTDPALIEKLKREIAVAEKVMITPERPAPVPVGIAVPQYMAKLQLAIDDPNTTPADKRKAELELGAMKEEQAKNPSGDIQGLQLISSLETKLREAQAVNAPPKEIARIMLDLETARDVIIPKQRDPSVSSQIQVGREISNLEAILDDPNATVEARTKAERELRNIAAQSPNATTFTFRDPTTGAETTISMGGRGGKAAGAMPSKNISDAETRAVFAMDVARFGKDVMRLASDPTNVGVHGNVRKFAAEWGNQLGLNIDARSVTEYKAATGVLAAALVKVLRSDGQMAEPERKELMKMIASGKMGEDSEGARDTTRFLVSRVLESAKEQIKRSGQPVPAVLLTERDLPLIKEMLKKKQLTEEEAIDATMRKDLTIE